MSTTPPVEKQQIEIIGHIPLAEQQAVDVPEAELIAGLSKLYKHEHDAKIYETRAKVLDLSEHALSDAIYAKGLAEILIEAIQTLENITKTKKEFFAGFSEKQVRWPVLLSKHPSHLKKGEECLSILKVGSELPYSQDRSSKNNPEDPFTRRAIEILEGVNESVIAFRKDIAFTKEEKRKGISVQFKNPYPAWVKSASRLPPCNKDNFQTWWPIFQSAYKESYRVKMDRYSEKLKTDVELIRIAEIRLAKEKNSPFKNAEELLKHLENGLPIRGIPKRLTQKPPKGEEWRIEPRMVTIKKKLAGCTPGKVSAFILEQLRNRLKSLVPK